MSVDDHLHRRFRVAVENDQEARTVLHLLSGHRPVDLDVDPGGGVCDPLTMRSAGVVTVSGALRPAALADVIEGWSRECGSPGIVVDVRRPIVSALQSPIVAAGRIEVLATESEDAAGTNESATRSLAAVIASSTAAASGDAPVGRDDDLAVAAGRRARAFATDARLGSEQVEQCGLRAEWIQIVWQGLVDSLRDLDPVTQARVRAASVRYELSLRMLGLTYWDDVYAVRLHLGMVEGLAECARSLVGEIADPDDRGGLPLDSAFEESAFRLSHLLGWLSSIAHYPVPSSGHHLPAAGETTSRAVVVAALLFILAHELAHVISDDSATTTDRAGSHAQELAADRAAVRILQGFLDESSPAMDAANDMAGMPLGMDFVFASIAIYLGFELLNRLVDATAHGTIGVPWPDDLRSVSSTTSHPSPMDRLDALLDEARLSGSADAVDAVVSVGEGYTAMTPLIQQNLPERVLTPTDAAAWLASKGFDPSPAVTFVGDSLRDIYGGDALLVLRSIGSTGELTDAHLDHLNGLILTDPRTVIGALAEARVGRVPASFRADAEIITAAALRVAERIEPALVRSAIAGRLGVSAAAPIEALPKVEGRGV